MDFFTYNCYNKVSAQPTEYGGDKYNVVDKEGMKEFVQLCHDNGIKIIPYVPSGYFPKYDPDFREGFAYPEKRAPPCKDKVYDYLWRGFKALKTGADKEYAPYIVPCYDRHYIIQYHKHTLCLLLS